MGEPKAPRGGSAAPTETRTGRAVQESIPPLDGDEWVNAAKMAELGMLTASLLHELRQPLFAIKASAQLTRVEENAEVRARRLDQILEQIAHVEDLVRYYGAFGKNVEPEVIYDLNDPVRAAIEMVGHRARKMAVQVLADLSPTPLYVRGRELAARQVAINLLQNACDAVEGRERRVVLASTRDVGTRVRLEVEDNGPGVPEAMRARVFEPFVTTKPAGRGTGLGLYIAGRMVSEARGRIELTAGRSGGARFTVELPKP